MKPITVLVSLTSTATSIRALNARAREICGDLGVMDVQGLHGDHPAQVRMCTEHPFGRNRVLDEANGASLAPIDDKEPLVVASSSDSSAQSLQERACVSPNTYGCSDGFCWWSCKLYDERFETGKWCWLAYYYGKGDWATCNTWEDCEKDPTTWCGVGDNCASCGCSC